MENSFIYSKEHQRLLKKPVRLKPFLIRWQDEKVNRNYHSEMEAYNNWLSSQPLIPEEYREYFSNKYRDGEELKEGVHFEIGGGQRKRNRDGTTTRTELVALPIIKEEQKIV